MVITSTESPARYRTQFMGGVHFVIDTQTSAVMDSFHASVKAIEFAGELNERHERELEKLARN